MAGEATGNVTSYPASADLSAKQFFGMTIDSSGELAVADLQKAAPDGFVGVLENKPTAQGRAGLVQYAGRTKIEAGGTFAVGDKLTIASDGQFVKFASGDANVGIAVLAGVDGEISEMQIIPGFIEP